MAKVMQKVSEMKDQSQLPFLTQATDTKLQADTIPKPVYT